MQLIQFLHIFVSIWCFHYFKILAIFLGVWLYLIMTLICICLVGNGWDKKAFLSGQCKEIEEHNGMGKTRDLFKKIRDTKGTFHVKIGSMKDRNGMDLTEAEDIKKRWQEYTEEL